MFLIQVVTVMRRFTQNEETWRVGSHVRNREMGSLFMAHCTSYETLLRDSKSLEDLRGVTTYQSYPPWHAHNFRTQSRPDLDSFQWQWRLGSSPNGAPTNWRCGHLANGFVKFEHRPGYWIHCWYCFRIFCISEVSCGFYWSTFYMI